MPPEPSNTASGGASAERLYYERLEQTCRSVIRLFEQGSAAPREKTGEQQDGGSLQDYQKNLASQMGSLDENLKKLIGERSGEQ